MSRCQACGRNAPTRHVELYQNIGMLVLRSMRSIRGNLCRRCIKKHAFELTGLTLVTGWWGVISFIINPFIILNNVVRYLMSLSLADGAEAAFPVQSNITASAANRPPLVVVPAAHPLASFQQDIRLRLRSGETPAQIAAFLAPRAGVSLQAAQTYAENLRNAP